MPKIFKNNKLIKKCEKTFPRSMYLESLTNFGKIFVQKHFLPILKNKQTNKQKINKQKTFWRFLKNTILRQYSVDLIEIDSSW